MRLTVAICTWNRAASLARCLEGLAAARVPRDLEWEVLVVDNNSRDDTASVAGAFASRLPVRRLVELAQGLSHARNAATRAARGEYIVWTDDDVVVSPGWLEAYVDAFAHWPGAAIFGGSIAPLFEAPAPPWLETGWRVVPSAFAALEPAPAAGPVTRDRIPFGANFSARAEDLRRHRFDPALGAQPGGLYYGEETQVIQAILDAGGTGRWVPGAAVQHVVPTERMTVAYLRTYFERTGRTAFHLDPRGATWGRTRVQGRPLWLWRRLIATEIRYRVVRATRGPEAWLVALRDSATIRGMFEECGRRSERSAASRPKAPLST